MLKKTYPSRKNEIITLLSLFGAAFSFAFILLLVMLYYYGPSGAYLGKNVLLSPENAMSMRFNEGNTRENGYARYVLDRIEFKSYDSLSKQRLNFPVNMHQYTSLFNMLAEEISLEFVSDEIKDQFDQLPLATLLLKIRRDDRNKEISPIPFLIVEILIDGDYYRVQLRTQAVNGNVWAYFYDKGIYNKILKVVSS